MLGENGAGIVALARHEQQGTPVAIKCLRREFSHDQAVVKAFLREARAATRLQGEQRCRVSEVGTLENGTPYIVLEFMDGMDERELARTQGRLALDMVADFLLQACESVAQTDEPTRAATDETTAAKPWSDDDQVPSTVQVARTAKVRAHSGHRRWWWSVALGAMIALILIGAGLLGRWLGQDGQNEDLQQTADVQESESITRVPVEIGPDTSTVEVPSAPPAAWTPDGEAMVDDDMRSSELIDRISSKSSRRKSSSKSSRRKSRADRKAEKPEPEPEVKPVDKIYEWTR